MAYDGLSSAEWDDIHLAVREGMGYVAVPVQFLKADPQATDPWYGEGVEGEDGFQTVGTPLRASMAEKPMEERLTKMGVQGAADVLLFIPRGFILDWEAANEMSFAPALDWEFIVNGHRYNVDREPRTDPLPVGDGTTTDFIGMVITGSTKPRRE